MVQCGDSTALGWRGDLNVGKKTFTNHCQDFFCMIWVCFFLVYICFFSALFISWFHGMVWCVTSMTDFWVLGLMIFFASLFFWRCFGVFFYKHKVYGIRYIIIIHDENHKKAQDSFEISSLLGDITWTIWTWDMYVFLAEKISPASLFVVETPLVYSWGNQTFPEARLLWIFLCCVTFKWKYTYRTMWLFVI